MGMVILGERVFKLMGRAKQSLCVGGSISCLAYFLQGVLLWHLVLHIFLHFDLILYCSLIKASLSVDDFLYPW